MSTGYLDCKDAYQNGQTTSGTYTINPDNQTAFQVYCDMDTDGGGWTVIQRRMDGSVSFDQSWSECETGFGNVNGEYWLGLRYIHHLTASASQEMRVDLEDFESNTAYALYRNFIVAGAADQYRLQVSGYSGTAGDAMYYNSGQQFTTKDRDNDQYSFDNCAVFRRSPWWHRTCTYANLNGIYSLVGNVRNIYGINWYQWRSNWFSMKKANMKVRRR